MEANNCKSVGAGLRLVPEGGECASLPKPSVLPVLPAHGEARAGNSHSLCGSCFLQAWGGGILDVVGTGGAESAGMGGGQHTARSHTPVLRPCLGDGYRTSDYGSKRF